LVRQQLQSGVDGAGARAPDAAGARFELLHDLVAVARLLLDEQQDRGADVAAADPPAAPSPAADAGRAGNPHREEIAGTAPGPAGTGLAVPVAEEDDVFLVVHVCSLLRWSLTSVQRYIGRCQDGSRQGRRGGAGWCVSLN